MKIRRNVDKYHVENVLTWVELGDSKNEDKDDCTKEAQKQRKDAYFSILCTFAMDRTA